MPKVKLHQRTSVWNIFTTSLPRICVLKLIAFLFIISDERRRIVVLETERAKERKRKREREKEDWRWPQVATLIRHETC